MNPTELPTTQVQLYGLIVLAVLQLATALVGVLKCWVDAHAIKEQNSKQLEGQAQIKAALDGVTAARVEAGHTQGMSDQREMDGK